jgi:Type I phosphodiesterase / nucleotide pyrophosphatase
MIRSEAARPASAAPTMAALLTVCTLVAACTGGSEPDRSASPRSPSPATSTPTAEPTVARGPFVRVACSLPAEQVELTRRGYDPQRSGQVQIVPVPPSYFGNHSHSGPWPYLQRVPLFFYGPGHVPRAGEISRPVEVADVPPTLGAYLGFPFDAPDGGVLDEAVDPSADPARLVVVVVWDGGGRGVLDLYPNAWPNVRRAIPDGAWFRRAIVGTSPSVSPAVHATLGTGAIPRRHGIVDLEFFQRGTLRTIRDSAGLLELPTIGDLYDRAEENEPVVGMVGNGLTVGMLGRGTAFPGGDRDILALHGGAEWIRPPGLAPDFSVPGYLNGVPGFDQAIRRVDASDGQLDGRWMADADLTDFVQLEETPAFTEWETAVIREVIRRERFGADEVPDLLFVNYKQVDKVGHRWSMNSPQAAAVVRGVDRAFRDLTEILNREVGRREWVLAITADHGSTPDASVTGAFNIDIRELHADLQAAFDQDGDSQSAIRHTRVTQVWLDEGELREGGNTVEDVAAFLGRYRQADNDSVGAPEPGRRVFEAAFPSELLDQSLPCLRRSNG